MEKFAWAVPVIVALSAIVRWCIGLVQQVQFNAEAVRALRADVDNHFERWEETQAELLRLRADLTAESVARLHNETEAIERHQQVLAMLVEIRGYIMAKRV